jgi:ligand-binding sensor domain-containing protein/two-component sensor histidine kinase
MKGLNRFDGRYIKIFQPIQDETSSLYGSSIQSPFFEDNQGDIWFTTYDKSCISVYRCQTEKFEHYFIPVKKTDEQDTYTALHLELNRWLWVVVNDKLFRFDTKSSLHSIQYLHDLQGARFVVDTSVDGHVQNVFACYWAYKKGGEIIRYDKNLQIIKRQTYFSDSEKKQMPLLIIRQAIIDNDTLVWLATDKGLVALNPQQNTFKLFSAEPFGTTTRHIALDKSNRLFVTTDKTPLLIFDKLNQVFNPLSIRVKNQEDLNQTNQTGANEVYIDKSNFLWLSVSNQGVYFAPLKNLFFLKTKTSNASSMLTEGINQIFEDKKGKIWASSSSTLYNYHKKWQIEYSFNSKSWFTNTQNNDILSVSTNGLVQYFDNKTKHIQTIIEKPEYGFRHIIPYKESNFYIGSNRDLLYLNTNKGNLKPMKLNDVFYPINIDNYNNVWCGTAEDKIVHYLINSDTTATKKHEITNKGIVNHFFNSPIDTTILWAATTKGILKINTLKLTDTLLTEKDGLPDYMIQAVLEDKKGNLWCSTNRGIISYNPFSKKYRLFTTRDGLSANSYNPSAALLRSNGEMWFGSIHGVDSFHPDSILAASPPPPLALSGLKIYDKYWQGDTALNVVHHIGLKYFENTLTFELAALDFADPGQNKFKVFLENYDHDWVNLNTQNFVTYVNLPAGHYVFKFIACNAEGIWNETPRIVHLTISPPYWKTWWFISLCVVGILGLLGYVVYLRLSKLFDLQDIRIKLYENLHDDLGSRLTIMVLKADLLYNYFKSPNTPKTSVETPSETLSEMRTIGSSIVANMRRLVWATDPSNDTMTTIINQMTIDKESLLPNAELIIDKSELIEKLKLDGNKRYQMLSIFNEALTNILKYAEATLVKVSFDCKNDVFTMTIHDNGKGFDTAQPRQNTLMSGGQGFRNMRNRAKRINGTLSIQSQLGEGTRLILEFPLKQISFFQRVKHVLTKSTPI